MKRPIQFTIVIFVLFVGGFTACKKNKVRPQTEPPLTNDTEVITTLKLYVWDSISNTAIAGAPFTFMDVDGEGGDAGVFLNKGADSLLVFEANRTYKTRLIIMDESKEPPDTISNTIAADEGYEHMIFYNGNPTYSKSEEGNSVLKSDYPNYTVKLNESNIVIRYIDSDNGNTYGKPTKNIGLETFLRTNFITQSNFPFIITLRHQPDSKNGTYGPGETDIEVRFKIKVN